MRKEESESVRKSPLQINVQVATRPVRMKHPSLHFTLSLVGQSDEKASVMKRLLPHHEKLRPPDNQALSQRSRTGN